MCEPVHVGYIPRDTLPLVVVVVVAYVRVLSGNVGEVNCSCQSLVILSVYMSIVLYILFTKYHCIYRVHI